MTRSPAVVVYLVGALACAAMVFLFVQEILR